MIALVEGASRKKTPNEIALNTLLVSLTIIFMIVIVTLYPIGVYSGVQDVYKRQVILCDQELGKNKATDDGIAAQTMMLGAVEQGWGGCMLGNIRRDQLAAALGIDQARYSIDLVLALGRPRETVRLVDVPENGDTRYYRDGEGVHYVPKRRLEELIL